MENIRPEKRKKFDSLWQELKKIKREFIRIKETHAQNIHIHIEDDLHPEARCSHDDCPVELGLHKVANLEEQFKEAETEMQWMQSIMTPNDMWDDGAAFELGQLPNEIIMGIFKYLNHDDLCRIGRACKTFHEIARSPIFWKRIRANIGEPIIPVPEAILQLIKILPSFVTSISLNFTILGIWYIEYRQFTRKLRQKCPNLQSLVLNHMSFEIYTENLVVLCTLLPKNLRVLALPHCYFHLRGFGDEPEDAYSNIEVLDLSGCDQPILSRYSLNCMPNLKELHLSQCNFIHDEFFHPLDSLVEQLQILDLERTSISTLTFPTLVNHGQHLTELYVCWTLLEDRNITFDKDEIGFPCLRIICLRGCNVTNVGVLSFVRWCSSLEKVFVGNNGLMPEYTSWGSEIIEDLGYGFCCHSTKADHMRDINILVE